MLFRKPHTPPVRQSHSLALKVWTLEATAHGWGIVGIVVVVVIVAMTMVLGPPLAKEIIANVSAKDQTVAAPSTPPPDRAVL